jgi:hypothetical protein
MFDGECRACQHEEDEEEVRVLTEEEVENDPEMPATSNDEINRLQGRIKEIST